MSHVPAALIADIRLPSANSIAVRSIPSDFTHLTDGYDVTSARGIDIVASQLRKTVHGTVSIIMVGISLVCDS